MKTMLRATAYITAMVMMIAVVPVSPAGAQTAGTFIDGNLLFRICKSRVGADEAACRLYISGVTDGANELSVILRHEDSICPPF